MSDLADLARVSARGGNEQCFAVMLTLTVVLMDYFLCDAVMDSVDYAVDSIDNAQRPG